MMPRSREPFAVARRLGRALLIGLLLVAPATLPSLAGASPPDPSWRAGISAAADHDDVVMLIGSLAGAVTVAAFSSGDRLPPLRSQVLPPADAASSPVRRAPAG